MIARKTMGMKAGNLCLEVNKNTTCFTYPRDG